MPVYTVWGSLCSPIGRPHPKGSSRWCGGARCWLIQSACGNHTVPTAPKACFAASSAGFYLPQQDIHAPSLRTCPNLRALHSKSFKPGSMRPDFSSPFNCAALSFSSIAYLEAAPPSDCLQLARNGFKSSTSGQAFYLFFEKHFNHTLCGLYQYAKVSSSSSF